MTHKSRFELSQMTHWGCASHISVRTLPVNSPYLPIKSTIAVCAENTFRILNAPPFQNSHPAASNGVRNVPTMVGNTMEGLLERYAREAIRVTPPCTSIDPCVHVGHALRLHAWTCSLRPRPYTNGPRHHAAGV